MERTTWLSTLQDEGGTLGRTITPPQGGEHGRRWLAGAFGREEGKGKNRRLLSQCADAETTPLVLKWQETLTYLGDASNNLAHHVCQGGTHVRYCEDMPRSSAHPSVSRTSLLHSNTFLATATLS